MSLTIGPAMPAKRPPKTAFAERLFTLRKARGMTQVQLAEALGTSQRVISHYETAAELPPSASIVALARVLEVSADELLGLKAAAKTREENPHKGRLWKRFQRMESLPERDQRAVLRLINSLVTSNSSGRSSNAHQ